MSDKDSKEQPKEPSAESSKDPQPDVQPDVQPDLTEDKDALDVLDAEAKEFDKASWFQPLSPLWCRVTAEISSIVDRN